MKNICKNVSSRPNGLFCRCCWNDSPWISFPATITQLFSQSSSPTHLAAVLIFFDHQQHLQFLAQQISKNQHQRSLELNVITQKGNCGSPAIAECKCTKFRSRLSTKTSRFWLNGISTCLEATILQRLLG